MPEADTTSWPPQRIAAGVVLYHPFAAAKQLVEDLAGQFSRVFVVENEPAGYASDNPAVQVERNAQNLGLAVGINQICDQARRDGFAWLVLFDQDSRVPGDFGSRLTDSCRALEEAPALLAANYYTELCGERFTGYRSTGDAAANERVVALNAGSLVDLAIHQHLGGHCEDLFVDHVDHEYCLRLRRAGFRVLGTREPLFDHEVGRIVCTRRFGRVWQSGGHPPERRREWAEGLMRLVKTYWRFEPGWCTRMVFVELPRSMMAMLVLERDRPRKLAALFKGLGRGLFRKRLNVS